ncbi:DNRLRE domain-containing protein [Streptomyces sp. NPDC058579]|uniref:DNRLRE domain-containing protein n=1 Tax=Streptomyces sp. NPDC058579 TaxID=3346548 RepID=UPI0036677352
MDASKASETTGHTLARETSPGDTPPVVADATRETGSVRGKRGRRFYTALAVLLAVAVAAPLTVHLATDEPGTPRAAKDTAPPNPLSATEATREAKRTGKDVEAEAERTAHSTTWAQPNGLLRTRTYSGTIRAKVGGEWKKIDTTLARVKGGFSPRAVNDPLLFSAGSSRGGATSDSPERTSRAFDRAPLLPTNPRTEDDRSWTELVRLTVDGHDLVVSWPGPLPAPVIDGPRALYENVRPGIDLLLTARDGGYSHVLVVHTREAAEDPLLADLDYRLSSPTMSFALDKDTHVVSARDAGGKELAAAPTPYMWDSAGTVKATVGEPIPPLAPSFGDTTLTLPGLAGPQPGTHEAALGATLDADNVLELAVSTKVLTDPDTVYPVFIDPPFTSRKTNWTLLYKPAPTSSFWDGRNFNDGTNEARVGYEATTGGLSRAVFNFEHPQALHGVTVQSSYVHFWQTYSWGCSKRQYNVHLTGVATTASTWNNQPTWGRLIRSHSNGVGYDSASCPDAWVKTDIKSVAQDAATKTWNTIALGLRAANEGDTNAWKKFMANGEYSPYIETTYNRPPAEPLQKSMITEPGGVCDTASPYLTIGKSDITFRATGSDPDKNLEFVHLKVWPTGYPDNAVFDQDLPPASNGAISQRIEWTEFTHGKTYSWSAWSRDTEGAVSAYGPAGTAAYCQFTIDNSIPSSPTVTSAQFPPPGDNSDVWSSVEFGIGGDFTFSTAATSNGVTTHDKSVIRYEYTFNTANVAASTPRTTTAGAPVTAAGLKPPMAGVNTLYVWAFDGVNRSAPAKYVFNVRPRKVVDPAGDVSGDGTPDLLAVDASGNLRTYPADAAGDVNIHMPGAHGAEEPFPSGYWKHATANTPALISHVGDWYPGDGVNDVVARMPDGKLYLYPGDGYGSFDVDERVDILLPAGAPNPASLTQLAVTRDITGDGLPDMFARAGTQLWAFTGYTGGSFTEARLLAGSAWDSRDIVSVDDITDDGVPDLLFRSEEAGRGLLLRHGKAVTGGGVDLNSLAAAANSGTGKDEVYGTGGWNRASMPMIQGTPDATGDGFPDFWAVKADGTLRFYRGGKDAHGTSTLVGEIGWTGLLTLG